MIRDFTCPRRGPGVDNKLCRGRFSVELEFILKMEDRLEAYMALAKLYLNGSSETKAEISDGWAFDVLWKFPKAKRLACQKGERWSSRERAEALAAYYGIASKTVREEWETDLRDVLVGIGLKCNAFILAGLKPEEVFGKVIPFVPPDIRGILTDFLARKDEDKNLNAWNLQVVKNKDGEPELEEFKRF